MKNKEMILVVVVLLALVLGAFTFRGWPGGMPAAGHTNDERAIRQLNEECLHAHDIADAATLDQGGHDLDSLRGAEYVCHVRHYACLRPKSQ